MTEQISRIIKPSNTLVGRTALIGARNFLIFACIQSTKLRSIFYGSIRILPIPWRQNFIQNLPKSSARILCCHITNCENSSDKNSERRKSKNRATKSKFPKRRKNCCFLHRRKKYDILIIWKFLQTSSTFFLLLQFRWRFFSGRTLFWGEILSHRSIIFSHIVQQPARKFRILFINQNLLRPIISWL